MYSSSETSELFKDIFILIGYFYYVKYRVGC